MGEAKRRRAGDYSWKGKDGDQFAQILAHVPEGSNGNQILIGHRPGLRRSRHRRLVKLCESLWHGERITKIRKGIEAEQKRSPI
jgi:hypothetical protein